MYYLYNDKQHDKSEHLPTCHHHPHIAQWLFVSSFHLTKVGVSLRWHRKTPSNPLQTYQIHPQLSLFKVTTFCSEPLCLDILRCIIMYTEILKSPSIQYSIPFQNSCRLSRSLFVTSCNRAHNSRIYVCFFWEGFAKWNNSSNKMTRLSTFQLPTDMSQLSTPTKLGDGDFTMWIRVVCVW